MNEDVKKKRDELAGKFADDFDFRWLQAAEEIEKELENLIANETRMSKKKWLVLSDYITSKNDGDRHFISCKQLVDLYRVNPSECIFGQVGDGKRYPNLPTLSPRYDGDYSLPSAKLKRGEHE